MPEPAQPAVASAGAQWAPAGVTGPHAAPKDGRFQAALECIAEAHSQEVWNLREENQHLRGQIVELRDHLRQVQARIICSKIDEPKMQSVAQSVAEDVAGWMIDGGIDDSPWRGETEPPQDWRAPGDKAKMAAARAPADAGESVNPTTAKVMEPAAPADNASVLSELDLMVQESKLKVAENGRTSVRTEDNSDMAAARGHFTTMDSHLATAVEDHCSTSMDGERTSLVQHNDQPVNMRSRRFSIQEILSSPQAQEVRMCAQKTMEAKEHTTGRFARALRLKDRFAKSVVAFDPVAHAAQRSVAYRIVHHSTFDIVCAVMIFSNSILIGWSTQYLSYHREENLPIIVLGHFCACFFLFELVLRMLADGRSFFTSQDQRFWNLFDVVLVVFSVIEFLVALNGDSSGVGSSIKTIKMLRIMRLIRVFRFFKDLGLLALMVIDSLKSLMNALAMLLIITYVFAIWFTSMASKTLHNAPDRTSDGPRQIDEHFGNLWKTLYALMQAMLSGISWGELTNALLQVEEPWGAFCFSLFVFYVFFTMLAVLNIITGVFVDNAVETARTQRDYLVQKEMELKEMYVREMQKLFSQMDEDKSGSVTLAEIKDYFEDPDVKSYFTALGLDPEDSERLFNLLDDDGSGELRVNEFIDGCLRLKGQARSIDLYALLLNSNRLEKGVREILEVLPRAYRVSQRSLHEPGGHLAMLPEGKTSESDPTSPPPRRPSAFATGA